MALNYQTLTYKPIQKRTLENGKSESYLDLLAKTWSEHKDDYSNALIVNQYYVARPDLISFAVYGTDKFGDMICKFNGISNPFDLNEGMILQIPSLDDAIRYCNDREYYACDLLKDTDGIKKNEIKKIYRDEPHSSSTTLVGDNPPYIIDRSSGIIIY